MQGAVNMRIQSCGRVVVKTYWAGVWEVSTCFKNVYVKSSDSCFQQRGATVDKWSPMVSVVNEGGCGEGALERSACTCVCTVCVCSPAGEAGEVEGGLMSPTHKPWLTQLVFKDLSAAKKERLTRASTHRRACVHTHKNTPTFSRGAWQTARKEEGALNYCPSAILHVFKYAILQIIMAYSFSLFRQ